MLVPAAFDGARLVDVGRAHLGVVATRAIGPLIAEGALRLDGAVAGIAQPVRAGQRLALAPQALDRLTAAGLVTPPWAGPVAVVHEDADLLVVDKPAGQHVHPMGRHREATLLGGLLWRAGARPGHPWTTHRPHPVHRLDRPTSGLLLVARDVGVRDVLQGAVERHEVVRRYTALVEGAVLGTAGVVDAPLGRDPDDGRRQGVVPVGAGGRWARSRWRVRERRRGATVLDLELETGRTHQLRAHLAHIGHPIVGDVQYGARPLGPPADPRVGVVIALRATSLSLAHPRGGAPLVVVAAHRELAGG